MIDLDGICPVFYPFIFVLVGVVLIFVVLMLPFRFLFKV